MNPNSTPVPSTEALLTNVLAGIGGLATQTEGSIGRPADIGNPIYRGIIVCLAKAGF